MKIYPEIVRDPNILGGMPVIKGTRISVAEIWSCILEGKSMREIVSDLRYAGYKDITRKHITAAVFFIGEQLI